jgi:hypothetical protein
MAVMPDSGDTKNASGDSAGSIIGDEDETRSFVRVLFEDSEYFAFKQTLIKHPSVAFTGSFLVLILCTTIPIVISSWDASTSSQHSATLVADTVLLVCVELLFLGLIGTLFLAARLDPVGHLSLIQEHASRLQKSVWFSHCVGTTCLIATARMGLHLLWFSCLDSCTSPPRLTATIPSCNPAGMSLPSDRVALALVLPVLVQVYLPGMRFCVAIVSWTFVSICMCIAYVQKGAIVESYQVLNAACFLYVLIKVDAFMWAAYRLHCKTMNDAAHHAVALQRTLTLEVALAESKREAAESASAELRALMGNVAHDLKTPLLAITLGIDLLRYVFASCVVNVVIQIYQHWYRVFPLY